MHPNLCCDVKHPGKIMVILGACLISVWYLSCNGCQIHNLKYMINPLEHVGLELSFGILDL
jgi:hypothetical protein